MWDRKAQRFSKDFLGKSPAEFLKLFVSKFLAVEYIFLFLQKKDFLQIVQAGVIHVVVSLKLTEL